jgi:UDP-glucose 4-epimerase
MHEQYQVPYTICRPFNCVGIGERRALGDKVVPSGNIKLAMSHVVPDLVQKILRGQSPLRILGDGSQVRCYTYGRELARGIVTAMTHANGLNDDFNLSTSVTTSVLELAELIWTKIHGTGPESPPFCCESDEPFRHDVQYRVPDVSKARRLLGFEASTSLSEMLDEVIPWVRQEIASNRI